MGAKATMAKEPSPKAGGLPLDEVLRWSESTPEIIKHYFNLEVAGVPPELYIVCQECDEVLPSDTDVMTAVRHAVTHVPGAPPKPEDRKSSR